MARRLLLHIGLPKSGTTFLQTRMWHNRTALRDQGLLYPGAERMDHFHATKVVRGLATPGSGSVVAWERLLEEVRSWPDDVLLSHEFFCLADTAQAAAFLDRVGIADVTTVVTARDLVRQFPAVWQEGLKMGATTGYGDFMDGVVRGTVRGGPWTWDSQDLLPIVDRWTAALRQHGAPAPTIVTVPPQGADPELLWQRWCEVAGLSDAAFDPDRARANSSLGAAQAALLQRVVPHLQPPLDTLPERHRWLRGYLGHDLLVPQRGRRIGVVAPEHRARLRELAQETVAGLRERGLVVVGDLDDLVPPADPSPTEGSPDDVTPEEVVEAAARALAQAAADVRRLELRRRPARSGDRADRADRRVLRGVRRRLRAVGRAAGARRRRGGRR